MVQHIAFVEILEISAQSLVEKDVVDLLEGKLVLLADELNERHLVEGVHVVYGAPKVPQKPDEPELPAGCSVEQGSGAIDVQDVTRQSVFQEVLEALPSLEGIELWVIDDWEWVVKDGVVVEETALVVPEAEEVKRSPALAVLQVEVGVDPLHEDLEEVEGGKLHEEVLDAPFLVILILLIHLWLGHNVLRIGAIVDKVVHCFDQELFVLQVVGQCLERCELIDVIAAARSFCHKLISINYKRVSKVSVDCFSKFLDEIDEKFEAVDVYLLEFHPQQFFVSAD